MSVISIEKNAEDGVCLLTLNNPPLNVVTLEMTRALDEGLASLAGASDVRVLVVRGAGDRSFCAGSDIKEFLEYMKAGNVVDKKMRYENEVYGKLASFSKPTIAAIAGSACGGGLELAVCCDLIVAEENAKLSLPEVWLGVFPGSGGTIRVTRRVGVGRAKEMMFSGEPIDCAKALSWGLIDRIAPVKGATDFALDWARELAKRPNVAQQACKRTIGCASNMSEQEAIERILDISAEVFATEDCAEGVRAFFAKEKPVFRHR